MDKKKANMWGIIIRIALIILLVGVLIYLATATSTEKFVDYSTFQQQTEAGEISNVYVDGYTVYFRKSDSEIDEKLFPKKYDGYTTTSSPSVTLEWLQKLVSGEGGTTPVNVKYSSQPQTQSWWQIILPYIFIIGASALMFWLVVKSLNKSNNSAMSFGRSRATIGNNSKVTFADVAGAEEEKEELKEVVDFLKNPQKFVKLGARIPKGFLMVGPPGTGKTLLARAVAGESNVPFFSITGSDFVEMFVGVGASRVRDLFEQAKHATPCIVFIDEIDAVGRQRGAGLGGGNDEREQTLNQLLTQMDGFEPNSGIVVMAATNRADVLDPALTRPGRFDRQIYVYPPDVKGREEILKVHARNKKIASDVNFKDIARLTTGFTGADLELVLNEAAIFAARENRADISRENVLNAINKVTLGPQKKSRVVTERDKKITAYHESGHAILGKLLMEENVVQEVSIIPRGSAAGYTLQRPKTDDDHIFKTYLENDLVMCMGGRAAETIIFGDYSAGASGDIKQATNIATKMVTEWGMSPLGPINYKNGDEMFLGRDYLTKSSVSEEMSAKIDAEVSKLINGSLEKAITLLKKNRVIMEEMVKLLYERETIYAEEIDMLMAGKTAEEVLEVVKKKDAEDEERRKKALEKELADKKREEEKAKQFRQAETDKENRKKAEEALDFLNKNGIINAKLEEVETKPEEKEQAKPAKEPAKKETTSTKKTTTKKQPNNNKENDGGTK